MFEVMPVSEQQLATVAEKVHDYVSHSKAANTLAAYEQDWRYFTSWCSAHGVSYMPAAPETVAAYIADIASTYKVSTIERRLSSISKAHSAAGFENPASRRHSIVKDTLGGIRRAHGVTRNRKAAVRVSNIHTVLEALPDTIQAKRDRALLLLGYICALRRSEIVALDIEDLTFTQEGMQVLIRRSKTDQEARGRTFGIRYGANPYTCVVRAVQSWMRAAEITSGALFRAVDRHGNVQAGRLGDRAVALTVKRLAKKMGLDPAAVSGHSLRAGFITDQVAKGTPSPTIMDRSRHHSVTVFNSYYREADIYAVDYGAIVGL